MQNSNPVIVPFYYRWLIRCAMPFYRLAVHKKSAKLPTYEREVAERFAKKYLPTPEAQKGVIWCHAVSLGELNSAYPLLKILLNQGFGLWITSTTQTGFDRAEVLFADEMGKSVQHSFVPVDDVETVSRFLKHINPVMAIFVETELWATTLALLAQRQIPSVMVNARLTEKSFLGYQKFSTISQSMMQNLSLIITQDAQSAKFFRSLRADSHKIRVLDSLKWAGEFTRDDDLKKPNCPVWVAGSTHDGEEMLALSVHKKLLVDFPKALLVLVPRHPERFDEVAKLCEDSSLTMQRQSKDEKLQDSTQVYLIDRMGELVKWYGVADVAMVGGSFVDVGGHNPIEPASFGVPVVMGQFVKNCTEPVGALSEVGALVQADGENALYDTIKGWLTNPKDRQAVGEKGKELVAQKQKSANRQCEILLDLLSERQ